MRNERNLKCFILFNYLQKLRISPAEWVWVLKFSSRKASYWFDKTIVQYFLFCFRSKQWIKLNTIQLNNHHLLVYTTVNQNNIFYVFLSTLQTRLQFLQSRQELLNLPVPQKSLILDLEVFPVTLLVLPRCLRPAHPENMSSICIIMPPVKWSSQFLPHWDLLSCSN